LITACNLAAILLLGRYAFQLLDDYMHQKRAGNNPSFNISTMPEIKDDVECW
jgi:AGCS family alanine or glycine:cation symporter